MHIYAKKYSFALKPQKEKLKKVSESRQASAILTQKVGFLPKNECFFELVFLRVISIVILHKK